MSEAFASSASDPYPAYDGLSQNHVAGRAIRSPSLTAGESTAVLVVAGQSNAGNNVDTAASLTNGSKIDNFNIWDGGTYAGADPLLGCTGSIGIGNIFSRLADNLITAGIFARIILVPIAYDATTVAQWGAGGTMNCRLTTSVFRLKSVGLAPTAFLWMQGESDQLAGTTQAAYAASLAQVIATPRVLGVNAPWFIGKCSYIAGASSAPIRAAQAGIVNGTDIFAGADTDTLTGSTNRQSDNTHFKATGADAAATLWKTALDAVF